MHGETVKFSTKYSAWCCCHSFQEGRTASLNGMSISPSPACVRVQLYIKLCVY